MKKKMISMMAFLFVAGFAQPVLAQVNGSDQQNQTTREIPSPENRARKTSKEVKKMFDLTEDQYNKVYKLYLQQEKNQESDSSMPGGMGGPGGMPGGMGGPGGMSGGMGGPGGMPGGMGGPGGGMSGGGMGPGGMSGGNFSSSSKPADMEKMKKQMQAQREKQHQKLAKKMKKILSADQFERWDEWDQKQMQEPMGPRPEGPGENAGQSGK